MCGRSSINHDIVFYPLLSLSTRTEHILNSYLNKVMSSEAAICIFDGLLVDCRIIPSISGKIYRYLCVNSYHIKQADRMTVKRQCAAAYTEGSKDSYPFF